MEHAIEVLFDASPLNMGGPQAWVCDIAPALTRRGVAVSVVSFELVPPKDDVLERRLAAVGIRAQRVVLTGSRVRKLRLIRAAIQGYGRYDIGHFNSDVFSGVLLPFAKWCGIKVRIAHSRSPHWAFRGSGLKNRILHCFFRRLVRTYCTHGFGVTEQALEGMLGPQSTRRIPCHVLPSAICAARFCQRADGGERAHRTARSNGPVMGFIGRITASKNPDYLVEVLSVLRRKGAGGRLLLMGAGPEEDSVRSLALQKGIAEHVTFLPPGDNVAEVLTEQVDVLVLPSDFEGTPRVVTECQACGVPVVCSTAVPLDVCVVPELFHRLPLADGPEAWAKGILRASQARVSGQRIHECFSRSPLEINNQADLLVDLYRSFLSR